MYGTWGPYVFYRLRSRLSGSRRTSGRPLCRLRGRLSGSYRSRLWSYRRTRSGPRSCSIPCQRLVVPSCQIGLLCLSLLSRSLCPTLLHDHGLRRLLPKTEEAGLRGNGPTLASRSTGNKPCRGWSRLRGWGLWRRSLLRSLSLLTCCSTSRLPTTLSSLYRSPRSTSFSTLMYDGKNPLRSSLFV